MMVLVSVSLETCFFSFFFNDTAPTEIYTLPLHDALPILDGATVPIPPLSASASVPLIPGGAAVPGANQPIANTTYQIDPTYKPGRNHEWDITIQREMPGRSLLEVGYIGRHANNIYNPLEVNGVPWMMTVNGQSYAQAFDAVALALRAGGTPTPQPFFEQALRGSS